MNCRFRKSDDTKCSFCGTIIPKGEVYIAIDTESKCRECLRPWGISMDLLDGIKVEDIHEDNQGQEERERVVNMGDCIDGEKHVWKPRREFQGERVVFMQCINCGVTCHKGRFKRSKEEQEKYEKANSQ